jgi:hypothetical protein
LIFYLKVSYTEVYGSPYLITLADKLKELAKTKHLADILTRVREKISEMEFDGKKQMPQVATTLRKDIRLYNSGFHFFTELRSFRYEGEWKDNRQNGNGIYYYSDGQKMYDGGWKDDSFHGNGIKYNDNGNIYFGQYENGQKNGIGTLMTKDKKVIEAGFWENDELKRNAFN